MIWTGRGNVKRINNILVFLEQKYTINWLIIVEKSMANLSLHIEMCTSVWGLFKGLKRIIDFIWYLTEEMLNLINDEDKTNQAHF